MGDPGVLQEAIQRARQLALKMTQSAPAKRSAPGGSSDHSGPIKVTLAYEKPTNSNLDNHSSSSRSSDRHRRSSSRDYNKGERDSRDSHRSSSDYRDNNYNQKDSDSTSRSNFYGGHNSQSHYDNSGSSQSSHPQRLLPPSSPSSSSGPPRSGGESKIELIIPHSVIGLVIGKGGENIKRIQNESGATVRVDPNTIDDKGNKLCTITGTKQAVDEAHTQVMNVIENSAQNKRPRMSNEATDSYRMKIPAHRTGAIIGKGGETIKSIKQQSGCEIELDKNPKECGPDESVFIIRGSQDKIQKARSLIEQRLSRGGGGRDGGGGGRDGRDGSDHGSSRSSRGVATGANAAPVAQFTDLPTPPQMLTAPAGQQNSADMTAAWAACMAQYSTMFSQPAAQPNLQQQPQPAPHQQQTQVMQQQQQQQQQQPPQQSQSAPGSGPDYTDQWIEFYLANGRPDYAEQMIQMKKQQQAQCQNNN